MNYIGKRVRIKTIEELEAAGYRPNDNGGYTNTACVSPDIIDCMLPLCGTIGECLVHDTYDNTYLVRTAMCDSRGDCWYYGPEALIALEDDDATA